MSPVSEIKDRQIGFTREYLEGLKKCIDALLLDEVANVIRYLEEAYRKGKQIFIIGNGGSAATASHMACDLGKITSPESDNAAWRFRVTSLTDNVPWITALANDLGYEYVFSEQLKNLLHKGDMVIAISGSGNSPNIIEGIREAKFLGATVLGILGFDGGKALGMVDASILVRSENYGHVEDVHMVLDHLITAYFHTLLAKKIVVMGQTDKLFNL